TAAEIDLLERHGARARIRQRDGDRLRLTGKEKGNRYECGNEPQGEVESHGAALQTVGVAKDFKIVRASPAPAKVFTGANANGANSYVGPFTDGTSFVKSL